MEDPSGWKDSDPWMHELIPTSWEDQHSDTTVMFPIKDAMNIAFFMNFYVFLGCIISSNTLFILVF
jgi:hypothetical protein